MDVIDVAQAGDYEMEPDRDLEGRTPLHIAAWQGHTAMVELLLRHGADVNATDREQRTPLQSAAWQGHENVVWLLLKAGARSDQPCAQGATPLSIGNSPVPVSLAEFESELALSHRHSVPLFLLFNHPICISAFQHELN